MHKHLQRLDRVWIADPIVYITTCTYKRNPLLANKEFHETCVEVWRNAEELYGWVVGRYVLMPDHIHFFCQAKRDDCQLRTFIGKWKEWTSKYACRRLGMIPPIWQPEYFDHVLRSAESYEDKWIYIRDNPVRAGLAATPEEWPYQGELHALRCE
jgi:putative transposase